MKMTTPARTDVIQGDEQCREGHYRAKQDRREQTATSAREVASIPAVWNTRPSLDTHTTMAEGLLALFSAVHARVTTARSV
jgi:hypothetical protein